MQAQATLFLIQFFISYTKYNFINANPLLGEHIRFIDPDEFLSVVCIIRVRAFGMLTENVSCTGTLITNNLVITATQCFYNYGDIGFLINIGSHNITASPNYYPIWWISYDNWANIARISNGNTVNDIGLIKVSHYIAQANVPAMQISPTLNMAGQFIEIVGCGMNQADIIPEIKQTVPVYVLTNSECEARTAILRGEMSPMPNNCMCTISYPYAFVQAGDIGGPLIADEVLVGINLGTIPWMNGTFHADKVNVHLKVDGYRNFIASLIHL